MLDGFNADAAALRRAGVNDGGVFREFFLDDFRATGRPMQDVLAGKRPHSTGTELAREAVVRKG
jgi:hypothetical protein